MKNDRHGRRVLTSHGFQMHIHRCSLCGREWSHSDKTCGIGTRRRCHDCNARLESGDAKVIAEIVQIAEIHGGVGIPE